MGIQSVDLIEILVSIWAGTTSTLYNIHNNKKEYTIIVCLIWNIISIATIEGYSHEYAYSTRQHTKWT